MGHRAAQGQKSVDPPVVSTVDNEIERVVGAENLEVEDAISGDLINSQICSPRSSLRMTILHFV